MKILSREHVTLTFSCVFFLVSIGYLLQARPGPDDFLSDSAAFFVAGKVWRDGNTSYDPEAWDRYWGEGGEKQYLHRPDRTGVAYPPTLALITMPFSIFSFDKFRDIFYWINFLTWLSACIFFFWLLTKYCGYTLSAPSVWLCIGLAGISTQSLPGTMQIGQMGLIPLVAVLGMFWGWKNQRPYLCAVLVILASIKPQISLLFLIYLLFAGAHKGVILGGILTGVVSMWLMLRAPGPLVDAFSDMLSQFTKYRQTPISYDELSNYWSIPGTLGDTRFGNHAMLLGVVLGAILSTALGILHRMRGSSTVASNPGLSGRKSNDPLTDWVWHLALILGITVALMPLHPYDYIAIAVLMALAPAIASHHVLLMFIVVLGLCGRSGNIVNEAQILVSSGQADSLQFLPHAMNGLVFLFITALWIFRAFEHRRRIVENINISASRAGKSK